MASLLLVALPTSARAQIYVGDGENNTVTGYNLDGSALGGFTPINLGTDLIYGLAVSGSTLYVADGSTNYVGKYTTAGTLTNARWYNGTAGNLSGFAISDTTIGAFAFASNPILASTPASTASPSLSSDGIGALEGASGAFSGSVAAWHNQLYAVVATETVSSGIVSTLYHFDASTEPFGTTTVVDASSSFNGEAEGIATNGVSVFVADYSAGTVLIYPTSEIGGATFISGLDHPSGLAVADGILYVANAGSGTIGEYNALTGAVINANLISGLTEPYYVAVSAVPEPSSYAALLGAVALGLTCWRRSRRTA